MMLSYSETDYKVPGKDLQVALAMPLARKDISGQSSSTDTVTAGNKAKKLSVALTLGFNKAAELLRLSNMAEAVDDSGKPLTYTIADELAEALNIRQVKFSDSFRIDPQGGKRAWTIRFTLSEHLSIAEKKEQRAEQPQPNAPATTGEPVASADNTVPDAEQLTGFEGFLGKVDKALEPSPEASTDATA
ncbi:MAG: DNA-binding protein [Motiliproteus sp.]